MKSSFGPSQRPQTAAATGSVSKLATRTGLGSYGIKSGNNRGPPRVMGSQEVSQKKEYARKWNNALITEAIDAANVSKERIGALSPEILARDGLALFGLTAKSVGWLFSDSAYEFSLSEGVPLPFHRFQVGDFVFISRKGVYSGEVYEGSVMTRKRSCLVITTNSPIRGFASGVWRLDRGDDKVTISRSLDAVHFLTGIRATIPAQYKDVFMDGGTKQPGPGTGLLPIFLRPKGVPTSKLQKPLAEIAAQPPPDSVYKYIKGNFEDAVKSFESDEQWRALNSSQLDVIKTVPHRRFSLVRGPPGTGKTHTIVNLLRVLVQCFKNSNIIILATAFTNIGTDNILEGLLQSGVKALRIGAPTRVREELRHATLEYQIQTNPLIQTLERLHKEKARPDVINNVETTILHEVMDGVRVICSTCIAAASSLVASMTFPIVIVDESTQATEPAVLCPAVKGCEQLILFGDDFQLGPSIVTQNKSVAQVLELSLFQRLIDCKEIEPFTLGVQYRMHPSISEWPSRHYYSGRVSDGVPASARPPPPGITWPDSPEKRVVFLPSSSPENQSPDKSFYNIGEVGTVIELIRYLLRVGVKSGSVGVISPYSAQVRVISDRIRSQCGVDVDCSRTETVMEEEENGMTEPPTKQFISVYSVDGFQGREKDIIIFSAVRSNPSHTVGFLADWRRSNVMLTRARNALFVIGDPETLATDLHWRMWLEYVKANNLSSNLHALLGQRILKEPAVAVAEEHRERKETEKVISDESERSSSSEESEDSGSRGSHHAKRHYDHADPAERREGEELEIRDRKRFRRETSDGSDHSRSDRSSSRETHHDYHRHHHDDRHDYDHCHCHHHHERRHRDEHHHKR